MNRVAFCSAILACAACANSAEPRDDRDAAIKAIEKLGGTVRLYDTRIHVSLRDLRITDADLAKLKGLPGITSLELDGTPITDAGLAHLKDLTDLVSLSLYNTAVSDDGLEHLTGLKKLNFVLMKQTNVTEDGAKMLRKAIPDCETISHSPRTPAIALPVGKWNLTFANGVQQTCEIRRDGTATVAEPLRSSEGKTFVQGLTAKLKFADNRVERWTPVGDRFVVEHWGVAAGFPHAKPVLGIAEKSP